MKFFYKLKRFNYINETMSLDIIKSKLIANGNKSILHLSLLISIKFLRSLPYVLCRVPKADVLFLFSTKNQKDALIDVSDALSKSLTVADVSLSATIKGRYSFPIFYPYLLSIFFIPIIIFEYIFLLNNNEKIRLRNGFQEYALSLGYVISYYLYLKLAAPKMIVVSNDHNSNIRILISAAKKLNIKTTYIQHASISKSFPALEQFDLALLDGQYSKDIYSTIGFLANKTFLVGINKLDLPKKQIVIQSNKATQLGFLQVGIALNPLYSEEKLLKLMYLLQNQEVDIVVRLHPAQLKMVSSISESLKEFRFKLSNPVEDNAAKFISSCDCVIAGNSGILLEAAILSKVSIYFNLDSIRYDYYDFLLNGIALEMNAKNSNIENLITEYKTEKNMNVNYYDYSFGSDLYGYSADYCSEKIVEFIQQNI